MNQKYFRKLAIVLAIASSDLVCAQTPSIKPVTNATPGPHIIQIGSPLTYSASNAPDTYTATSTFGPTPVLVDKGAVKIWQDQVATGADGEWDIFHLQVVNGGPLANDASANFILKMNYTVSTVATFDAVANQIASNGTPFGPLTNFGSICCAAASNPILPGWSYYNSGFSDLLSAGTQENWQPTFLQPYSYISSGGINPSTANEFIYAYHFTLGSAVPTVNLVISAGAYGAFPTFGSGSWIEVYGTNLGVGPQGWTAADFTGVDAPTKLVGTSVTIGGQPAVVDYVDDTQVNVQAPGGLNPGSQDLIVTTAAGSSTTFPVNVVADNPGLLAPSSFDIGGTQYVVAQFVDGEYVLPIGAISGITSRPAKPGEDIVIYGIGFGSVKPTISPGQLAETNSSLALPFTLSIGGKEASIAYDGLAQQEVGVYQFNVTVPDVAAGNKVPLTFMLGGANGTQKNLFIAVGN